VIFCSDVGPRRRLERLKPLGLGPPLLLEKVGVDEPDECELVECEFVSAR
jgi:hypothetical protein